MKKTIIEKLKSIEKEYSIKILYAIESGSRAWGFESTDSDYDVRFIYCHDPDWYFQVLPKRDIIEIPIDDLLDFSGWEIKKTLFFLNKSNPVLFEWLRSPIIYISNEPFHKDLLSLSEKYFSPIASIYHYLHMAEGNFRTYLQNDKVKIKKYFYVLRPVLACIWIEKYSISPPMGFDKLIKLIDDDNVFNEVNTLLDRKKAGVELGLENKVPVINNFSD